MTQATLREIGIPVKGANWVKLFAGEDADGGPCLYATMGQQSGTAFVLRVDVRTGACRKFPVPVEQGYYPTAAFWSHRHRRLFVGIAYAGHLVQFDPRVGVVEDLGLIHADAATFPCRIDEAPDGTLYIGSYPGCDLTRYTPSTGVFTHFGRMDEQDMYFYPFCGRDGTIAGLVKMVRPHVVALDPENCEHRTVGPVADADAKTGSVNLLKGADGLLYIDTHEGALRVEGLAAAPVTALPDPQPAPTLPDGSTFQFLDAATFEFKKVRITAPTGEARTLAIEWEGEGTALFIVRRGPDDRLYGSSVLPEHLFSYDPATEALVDHGACSVSGGEAYSMAPCEGRLYIASYPAARLSIYDPAKPYAFGAEEGANPRDIGRLDEVGYRPHAMLCGPAGRVWIASIPDYGMWGGTLAWFEPRTGRSGSHRHLVPDCSPVSLAWASENNHLLVGMSVAAGTGAQPRAERVPLVRWDPDRDEKVDQIDFGLSVRCFNDLCYVGGGLLYALVQEAGEGQRPRMLLVDLAARRIVSHATFEDQPHGWCLELPSMTREGNWVYGLSRRGLFRMKCGTTDMEFLWHADADPDGPTAPGALLHDRYYFITQHRLRAVEIGGTTSK